MAQTLCIKCGSELKASWYCQLCQQALIFTCTSCDYITEEKVHIDCRNAEILAKTAKKTEDGVVPTATATRAITPTPTFIPKTGNRQQDSIVDRPKKEVRIDKGELSSTPSYTIAEKDSDKNNNNNSVNSFDAATAAWQSLVTYWMYIYGAFLKNTLKMNEKYYDIFWKPWINRMSPKRGR